MWRLAFARQEPPRVAEGIDGFGVGGGGPLVAAPGGGLMGLAAPPRRKGAGRAPHLSSLRMGDLARAIIETSKAIVYVKDLEGRYAFINRQFEVVLRVRSADLLGRTDFDLYDRATAVAIRANDRRILEAGASEEFEELIPVPGEEEPRVYVSVKEPLFDTEGRPCAVCGISTDITEWKRAEEALRFSEQRYRSLVEASAAFVWSTPQSGEFEADQPGWRGFTGQSPDELRGWGWLEAVHAADREETARAWAGAVADRAHYQVEHRLRRFDGVYRDMSVRAVPILARDGTPREWLGVHTDVTDRKAAERALDESRQLHTAAMAASGTGTYRWNFETGAVEWDDQMRNLFGVEPDEVTTFDQAIGRIHPEDLPNLMRTLELYKTSDDPEPMEFRVLLPDGGVRWLGGSGRTFCDAEGRPSYSIGGCIDVTRLKLAEERLSHRAYHDALTGMPNRAMLQATLDSLLAAGRDCPPFAFLLLDLDRFKEINDTFGHDCGDAVLQELKPRLDAVVGRAAGPGALVARLGGDEFGVVLPGMGRGEASKVAQEILDGLEGPVFVCGQGLEIGASVGVALHPEHGRDAATLMRVADIAMYAAKRARVGWAVYRAEHDHTSPRRLNMVVELRHAVEDGQLLLDYQPKVDLATMQDAGAEALVRWLHPREGIITPCVFVPLAEETGLIRPLSLWVLDRALQDVCGLGGRSGSGVAVNLAPDNLQDPDLVPAIVGLLRRYDVEPSRLTIEVTETAMMRNPARVKAVLLALHRLGMRVAIDDFGTGYSSLAYLKELPVDEVKVDRSFVKDMVTSRRDACIVRSVIDLGHNLGLKVVAEGVEDEESLLLLRSWGCDMAQGFHLSPPLAADAWRWRCVNRAMSTGG